MGQRVAIYCRVSTADQSCERQEQELLAYAHRANFEIIAVFNEVASGAKDLRSERKKVMAIAQDRRIDAILVTELTRWGRSTLDLMQTLHDLQTWNVSLIAQTGLQFDVRTAQGKLIASMMAALAEFEKDLLRERVRSGIAAVKAKGKYPERVPYKKTFLNQLARHLLENYSSNTIQVDNRTFLLKAGEADHFINSVPLSKLKLLSVSKEFQALFEEAQETSYNLQDILEDIEATLLKLEEKISSAQLSPIASNALKVVLNKQQELFSIIMKQFQVYARAYKGELGEDFDLLRSPMLSLVADACSSLPELTKKYNVSRPRGCFSCSGSTLYTPGKAKTYKFEKNVRSEFWAMLSGLTGNKYLFKEFLDLELALQILTSRKVTIVVFAGLGHTEGLVDLLARAGYQTISSKDIQKPDGNTVSFEDLNKQLETQATANGVFIQSLVQDKITKKEPFIWPEDFYRIDFVPSLDVLPVDFNGLL